MFDINSNNENTSPPVNNHSVNWLTTSKEGEEAKTEQTAADVEEQSKEAKDEKKVDEQITEPAEAAPGKFMLAADIKRING